MENYEIKILDTDKYIGYVSSDYLYTNILDFDNPIMEYIEDGKVISKGKYYYMYSNGNILVYKPSYDIKNTSLIHKEGKNIAYEKMLNFDDYFKPITNNITLLQFPERKSSSMIVEKDENGIFRQRISLKVKVFGGSEKCGYRDIIQYDINGNNHNRVLFDNGIYVDYLKLLSKEDDCSTYEISIINYGRICLDEDNYYLLPIYHKDNNDTICRIKFIFEPNIKTFSVKMNNVFCTKKDKIRLKFNDYGGIENIPIETNIKDIVINNKLDWVIATKSNNSIIIKCDKNIGEKRTGEFKFGYNRNYYTVLIEQDKTNNYKIITNRNNIKIDGDKRKVLIHVNSLYGNHDISIEDKCDWIYCDIKKVLDGQYYTSFDITLVIDKNMTYQDRKGYIKIMHSDDYNTFDIINVSQTYFSNDFDEFIAIRDDLVMEYNGNEKIFDVELFPFVDCTFSVTQKPSWMNYEIIDNNKLKISCERNLFSERKAIVEFINNDFPFTPLIKYITQKSKKG